MYKILQSSGVKDIFMNSRSILICCEIIYLLNVNYSCISCETWVDVSVNYVLVKFFMFSNEQEWQYNYSLCIHNVKVCILYKLSSVWSYCLAIKISHWCILGTQLCQFVINDRSFYIIDVDHLYSVNVTLSHWCQTMFLSIDLSPSLPH